MADFIAVIRRAVDGLSDNTPEMRVRVYERARTAVQRQLDNMKPRPADDVIARQIEKLDEAIATIEREFTGAPAAEPIAIAAEVVEEIAPPPAPPAPEPEPEPEPQQEAAPIPEPAPHFAAPEPVEPTPPPFLMREPAPVVPQPVEPKPEPAFLSEPKFEPAPQPRFEEPLPAPQVERPAAAEDDTMPPAAVEAETSWQREQFEAPLGVHDTPRPTERAPEPPAQPAWPPLDREAPLEREAPLDRKDNHFSFEAQTAEPQPATPKAPAADAWTPVVTDNPFHEPEQIFTPSAEPDVLAKHDALLGITKPKPAAEAKSWWDDVDAPKQPAPLPSVARDASWDSFEAFVGERSGANPAGEIPAAATTRGRDGMSIGDAPATPERKAPAAEERGEGRGKLVAGILAAILVLAGTGYAGWRFSDTILGFINGIPSTGSQTASKSQPASTTTQQPATTKPAAGTTTPAATTTPVATGPQKFTQRLMADGSEVDSGTSGEQVASAAQAEGKSVANQNEKPAPASTPAQAPSTPATTPPASQPEPANSQQAAPVKMFLYEERLGQASPTALEGTVTWSVKNDDQDGHKGKMIQGDISVPGRKMSAIFALRKNNDPTLPASHIIELTFSLPKEFEGRGIESVLRISMKDKEQEQGDPLVAVPAKITDYFHMIALNAFADAVKNNLNLLKSRDWIDIPVTYSNGRRALLTLQKGPEGQKVFDDVISSWQASGDGATPAATPPAQ